MKAIMGAVLAATFLLAAGVALAVDAPGSGPARPAGASATNVKKFQKETFALRDELAGKRIDLQEEHDKAQPDSARIASLEKDVADLEARIQASAEKYGVRPWGRGYGHGMMHGQGGPGYARGSGPGCGCGRW